VTSLQIGRAITSGLAVLVLAIVLDRISQVRGVDRSAV
jgi:ABC-type proline/glycine betaine transport system permease subunit